MICSVQLTKEQIEHYEQKGFLLTPSCFSTAELESLEAELPALFAEDTPRRILEKSGAVRTVFAAHTTNEVLGVFSRLLRLVEPAMQLLGSEVYIHQFKINAKIALDGDLWEWHQDFLYWHKEDGMPSSHVTTAAVFIHEVNDFNGPMLIIPGSHREGMIDVEAQEKFRAPPNGQRQDGSPTWISTLTADLKYKINKEILAALVARNDIYAVKAPAGSVMFFHGNMFHASAHNLSPCDRTSLFVTYNSVENVPLEINNPRPTFIASRDFSPIVPVPDDSLLKLRKAKV